MKLSVIVCTYNRAELLVRALQSLAVQSLDASSFEVIVVDNNSRDETMDVVKSFLARHANFRTCVETRQGLSLARNRGWIEARGDYVAFMDDDARAAPDWCERILDAFGQVSPAPVVVGGDILPWYEVEPPPWFLDDFEHRSWGEAGFLPPNKAKSGFSGSNMAFPREVLELFGGFRPDFGMVGGRTGLGEETELMSRIHQWKTLFWNDPKIRVFHWVPRKKLRPSYRFFRQLLAGKARARIETQEVSRGYMLVRLVRLAMRFFSGLGSESKPVRSVLLSRLEVLAYHLGLFLGSRYG